MNRVLYQEERVLYVFIILYLVIRLVYRVNCQSDFPIKNRKQLNSSVGYFMPRNLFS